MASSEDDGSSAPDESPAIGLAARIISVQNMRRVQYTVVTMVAIYSESEMPVTGVLVRRAHR